MKKITFIFIIVSLFLLVGCNIQPMETPTLTPVQTESAEPTQSTAQSQPTPSPSPSPALTPSPSLTATQPPSTFIPDENTYGPFVFGEYSFYIKVEGKEAGGTVSLISSDSGKIWFKGNHYGISNMDIFLVTASIMDLNFDMIPDFSFVSNNDGKRQCWLANGSIDKNGDIVISSFSYNAQLSSIPCLSRCFEFSSLYGLDYTGGSGIVEYKYTADGKSLTKSQELNQPFVWTIDKIAYALAGPGASVEDGAPVEIRGVTCQSYVVGGYLSIAKDEYGSFYLKDLPADGFYRLSLNPNGNWSKSEKVTPGMSLNVDPEI